MGHVVRNVGLAVLAISFITFVAFFGRLPAFRNTLIGFLHRVIWIRIPKFCGGIDRVLTGGRMGTYASRLGHHLFYEKHYAVTTFFLGLLTVSIALFLPPTWHYLSSAQRLLVYLLVPWPYIFTYLCQISGPNSSHLITPENNRAHLRHYPFDHVLYHPHNVCRTCVLPKPARSKHCSLCNACVARSDHHCVWVNNCVGRGNYKYFLGLLLLTALVLFYGSYLAYTTLKPEVDWHFEHYPAWHMRFYEGRSDFFGRVAGIMEHWTDILGTAFMMGGISRGGVGLLATLTAPLPLGLLAYHVYLIWAGMTTNETGKWAEVREDMADGLVFMADLKRPGYDSAGASMDGVDEYYHEESSIEYEWPQRSRQFLVRTADGQAPKNVQPGIEELVVRDSWRPIWNLGEVENIYDLGFWDNLREVLMH